MKLEDYPKPVQKAVKGILSDIEDRKGIGNECEQIDDEVKAEMLASWAYIINKAMSP